MIAGSSVRAGPALGVPAHAKPFAQPRDASPMLRASTGTIVLALALAGCVTPPPPGSDGAPPRALPAFATLGCAAQEIVAGVPPESLAPYLPDGFVAQPFPTDGLSGVIAVSVACETPPTRFGMVVIPLIGTPEGKSRENATAQGIVTTIVLSENDPIRATLESWGFGATLAQGTTTLEDVTPPGPPARVGRTQSTISSTASYDLVTTVQAEPRQDEGNFLRLFQVHERQVVATWDWNLTGNHRIHEGQATLQATGLSPLPEGASTGLGFRETADEFLWLPPAGQPTAP